MHSPPAVGKVYLVGAGPGDPSLITLRGIQCLGRGDLVLYDYLVNERILRHASEGAELVCLGRHGRDRIWTQDEINERMIAAAKSGQYVVRLKGGDVTIFAHQAEETAALAAAGVPYELVPGVTAALAAGCYLDLPLTHREHSSAVAFVTGQQKNDDDSPVAPLEYAGLAKFPGTLVFYMGVTTAPQWTAALIAAGKPATTPAMIVRRVTWPDQRSIRCTLEEVPNHLGSGRKELRPPVIVIVGDAVAHIQSESWFTSRPLFGQRILVTRPVDQDDELVRLLEGQGGEVLTSPAIEIGPPDDWAPVDAAIATLSQFDWLVFSSANGVQRFLDRVEGGGRDLRQLSGVKIACIGPGTSAELARYRLRADLQPPEFRAESLAAALTPHAIGKRCLLIRASRGREVLAGQLAAAGTYVSQVVVYSSRDVQGRDPGILQKMAEGQIDWVTVTSSAIANSLFAQYGQLLQKSRLASISPITTATLAEIGFTPDVEAKKYTMAGLVAAMTT